MQSSRKRKHQNLAKQCRKNSNSSDFGLNEPYPTYLRPTPEECRSVRDVLLNFHGFPQEFAKYRAGNRTPSSSSAPPIKSGSAEPNQLAKAEQLGGQEEATSAAATVGSDGILCYPEAMPVEQQQETVLDGLVSTLLSQNTTEVNSRRAFASLKSAFPTWEDVLAAELKCIENAIKCGGLAVTKASCIKNLLTSLVEKKGKLCLEYLREMSIDEVKQELHGFKGIGPKTVACVLMFQLQQDDFPVDTHVFRIAKDMGWIPVSADRGKAYLHLNRRIPNDLKFDLNCLLVTHGKICNRCTKNSNSKHGNISHINPCPLMNHSCFTDLKELT